MSEENLTGKQKRFCEEYVLDWNATRAAKAAGYSEETAYSIGSENLRKPELKAYIEEIQQDLQKLAGISKLSVLQELQNIIKEENTDTVGIKDKIKALEVVNKMLGFNDPEKHQVTTNPKELTLEETKAELQRLRKLKQEEQNMFDDD